MESGNPGKGAAPLAEASLLLAVLSLGINPVAVKCAVEFVTLLPFAVLRSTDAGPLLLGQPGVLAGIERLDGACRPAVVAGYDIWSVEIPLWWFSPR